MQLFVSTTIKVKLFNQPFATNCVNNNAAVTLPYILYGKLVFDLTPTL